MRATATVMMVALVQNIQCARLEVIAVIAAAGRHLHCPLARLLTFRLRHRPRQVIALRSASMHPTATVMMAALARNMPPVYTAPTAPTAAAVTQSTIPTIRRHRRRYQLHPCRLRRHRIHRTRRACALMIARTLVTVTAMTAVLVPSTQRASSAWTAVIAARVHRSRRRRSRPM